MLHTQNFTRKNADCGPLSNSSRKPPVLSGNLSAICRISTDYNIKAAISHDTPSTISIKESNALQEPAMQLLPSSSVTLLMWMWIH